MYVDWTRDPPLADGEAVAALYEVSQRTVRRHCTPAGHLPQTGMPRGLCGRTLYDAYAAADQLEGVAPRPGRSLAELRRRRQGSP